MQQKFTNPQLKHNLHYNLLFQLQAYQLSQRRHYLVQLRQSMSKIIQRIYQGQHVAKKTVINHGLCDSQCFQYALFSCKITLEVGSLALETLGWTLNSYIGSLCWTLENLNRNSNVQHRFPTYVFQLQPRSFKATELTAILLNVLDVYEIVITNKNREYPLFSRNSNANAIIRNLLIC